jgi:hypothetical protein
MLLVHILRNGTPLVPPFPENKIPALLRAKAILRSDYFWHQGMAEWAPVDGRWPEGAELVEPEPVTAKVELPTPAAPAVATTVKKRSRWEHVSLLQVSKTRYQETCAPWVDHISGETRPT